MSKYGNKITQKEYDFRVTSCAKNLSDTMNTKEGELILAKEELNARIDETLGVDVPQDIREKMFDIQQSARNKHLLFLIKGLVTNPSDPLVPVLKNHIQKMSKVLDEEDLMNFFGLSKEELLTIKPHSS